MKLTVEAVEGIGTAYDALARRTREVNGSTRQIVVSRFEHQVEDGTFVDGLRVAFCNGDIPYDNFYTDTPSAVVSHLLSEGFSQDDWEPVIE